MHKNRVPWYIGLGCGLLLLILLIPISFAAIAAVAFSVRSVTTAQNEGGWKVEGPVVPEAEQVPGFQPPILQEGTLEAVPPTFQNGGDSAVDPDLVPLFEQVNPGVVNISVQVTQAGQTGSGAGSGFIIDDEGHIATNNHVIRNANVVFVVFYNGLEARAEVVGTDPGSDLAILKVESLPEGARALPLADSDQVRVGQRVVAIGNPFMLGNTMTYGIVSAVGRVIPSGFTQFAIPSAIQTDAAINPGNSGGPLINMDGEVIGVNAQIETGGSGVAGNIGIGFAIPSNILRQVIPALIEEGSYDWPWLGVSGYPITGIFMEANNLETQQGAYIDFVVPEGPAAEAGLQGSTDRVNIDGLPVPAGGDVVIAVNGEPVRNFDSLLTQVAFKQPGEEIILTVLRDGETLEIPVTLQARPQNMPVAPQEQELPPGHP